MKKVSLILAAVILVAVAISVVFMMSRDSKSSGFEVSDGKLVISGSFAVTVPLSEISDLQLTDTMPAITTKTNGAWLRSICKGEFLLENNIKARLYADTGTPPFMMFKHNDTVFYINAETPAGTQSLYELMKNNIS